MLREKVMQYCSDFRRCNASSLDTIHNEGAGVEEVIYSWRLSTKIMGFNPLLSRHHCRIFFTLEQVCCTFAMQKLVSSHPQAQRKVLKVRFWKDTAE